MQYAKLKRQQQNDGIKLSSQFPRLRMHLVVTHQPTLGTIEIRFNMAA